MPYSVRCKACSSAFAIPDEIWDKRVKGRIATLKCRSCKAEIHVDGTKAGVVQISAPPPPADESIAQPSVREPQQFSAPTEQDRGNDAHSHASAAPVALPSARPGGAASEPVVAPATVSPNASAATTSQSKTVGTSAKAAMPGATATKMISASSANTLSHKPSAKAAREILAPESGWSLMPPPGEIEILGKPPAASSASPLRSTEAIPTPKSPPSEAKSAEQQPSGVVDPHSVRPGELLQEPAIDPDLWVVSFGEEDDRELTEKEIASELAKGGITLSTIVWQEGMPEWLPISGVGKLAKLAPLPKSAPRQNRTTAATKTSSQATKGPSPLATTRADAPAARQTATQRQRQPSHSQLEPQHAVAKAQSPAVSPRTPAVATEQTLAKGPPPLVRVSERSVDEGHGKSTLALSKVPQRAASLEGSETSSATSVAARPPVLIKRGQASLDPTARDAPEVSDDVLTSAPDVTAHRREDALPGKPPPLQTARVALPTHGVNSSKQPTEAASAASALELASQRSGPKQSFRPPKPVETATSLVTRTEASAGKDLLITDEDFLAMQRRFPKWALPVGIVGSVVVVGAIIYAANAEPELPPLPVTPVADTSTVLRENPANRAQPKHPQPNLDALPTAAASAAVATQEKDFARLFAQSASKTNGTFDSKAADRAAMNFMELAARCRVAPDPSGQARVVVTFSTAGQVLSVQVGSPYADTATGRCIDKALRNIKTKAFQGEPGRLPLTVPIH
ncbi:MAG TPA: GYF domain-containing protein [Polyangiaceae bacterium]